MMHTSYLRTKNILRNKIISLLIRTNLKGGKTNLPTGPYSSLQFQPCQEGRLALRHGSWRWHGNRRSGRTD